MWPQTAACDLPAAVKTASRPFPAGNCEFQIALVEDMLSASLRPWRRKGRPGGPDQHQRGRAIPLWRLLAERALCVNTTAAGGNASLMTLQAS
jgi:RHH-type proline utilization regulon transcriptional repressor/proline dehydrogenase/delta 1-pyrroline-5-carboxylate dehydrogenase